MNVCGLSQANDDMKNLLDSTDFATLFPDAGLKVRRFPRQTTHLFKLIPSDVGRHTSDLVTELEYPTLAADAREVLQSLIFHKQQVLTHSGKTFSNRHRRFWANASLQPAALSPSRRELPPAWRGNRGIRRTAESARSACGSRQPCARA